MRTEDITNVTRHRAHLRAHLQQVRQTGRPMFITNKRGETEAVLIGPETYDRIMEEVELSRSLSMIDRSMEQVTGGRGKDLRQAVKDIADELGIELNP